MWHGFYFVTTCDSQVELDQYSQALHSNYGGLRPLLPRCVRLCQCTGGVLLFFFPGGEQGRPYNNPVAWWETALELSWVACRDQSNSPPSPHFCLVTRVGLGLVVRSRRPPSRIGCRGESPRNCGWRGRPRVVWLGLADGIGSDSNRCRPCLSFPCPWASKVVDDSLAHPAEHFTWFISIYETRTQSSLLELSTLVFLIWAVGFSSNDYGHISASVQIRMPFRLLQATGEFWRLRRGASIILEES
jgi:hypothetical protein